MSNKKENGTIREIGAVREKCDGYMQIKTEDGWQPLARIVWLKAHPDAEYNPKTDVFFHLDKNYKNNDPANIEKITRREKGCVAGKYGGFTEDPEENKLLIAAARLTLATLDAAVARAPELIYKNSNYRQFNETRKLNARKYYAAHKAEINKKKQSYRKNMSPEQKERVRIKNREYTRKYQEKRKADPVKFAAYKEQCKLYTEKYRQDPEHRATVNAYRRKYYNEHMENDPEYRERTLAKRRERYAKTTPQEKEELKKRRMEYYYRIKADPEAYAEYRRKAREQAARRRERKAKEKNNG